jgi:hypothetical protein
MNENQLLNGSVADFDKKHDSLSYSGKVWLMIAAGYAAAGVLLYLALHGFN